VPAAAAPAHLELVALRRPDGDLADEVGRARVDAADPAGAGDLAVVPVRPRIRPRDLDGAVVRARAARRRGQSDDAEKKAEPERR
jgi:hypothetical protein